MDVNALATNLDQHRAETDASTERYVKSRLVDLASMVLARERIYLDLNYWVRLRDVVLGRSTKPAFVEILASLRTSVKEKKCLCPISDSIFLELMKQQDRCTRMATAELIDELSLGVSISPIYERMATEMAHFMHAALGYDVLAREQLVWTKLSYIPGIFRPVVRGVGATEQCVLQKAFFDHMWSIPLSDLVAKLDLDLVHGPQMADIAVHLNTANTTHANGMKSFRQVYKDEFIGGLDLASEFGQQVIERLGLESGCLHESPSDEQRQRGRSDVFGFLRTVFAQKPDHIARALPTLHVGALCHAAVRWDQKRKLTGNDLMDFHHSRAALPYCQAFLTDKPLCTLLQQRHLGVQEHFSCRIISSPEKAAAYLQ